MSAPQVTLGDRVYSIGHMPPTKSVRVQIAVARVIGEPLFKLVAGAKSKPAGEQTDEEKAAEQAQFFSVIALMAKGMDADELVQTMELVFQHVSIDGKPVTSLDAAFAGGRNKEMWQAFLFALKVNFSDFMPAALSASIAGKLPASN